MARGQIQPGNAGMVARLRTQLGALPNLPVGTKVLVPPGHSYEPLPDSFTELPTGIDPLRWAMSSERARLEDGGVIAPEGTFALGNIEWRMPLDYSHSES